MIQSTSLEALRKLKRAADTYGKLVFGEILKSGDKGLTAKEVQVIIGIDHATVSARAHELLMAGLVVRTGEKRRNPGDKGPGTGGSAFVLVVPPHVKNNQPPIPLDKKTVKKPPRFTVRKDRRMAGTGWLMSGKFFVAHFLDIRQAESSAEHLNQQFFP